MLLNLLGEQNTVLTETVQMKQSTMKISMENFQLNKFSRAFMCYRKFELYCNIQFIGKLTSNRIELI